MQQITEKRDATLKYYGMFIIYNKYIHQLVIIVRYLTSLIEHSAVFRRSLTSSASLDKPRDQLTKLAIGHPESYMSLL